MSRYEDEWERKMDNPRWKGKGGGGGGGGGGRRGARKRGSRTHDNGPERDNNQGRPQDGQTIRHPPGLRGREIGLWYARQGREKKQTTARNEEFKNRVYITLDGQQECRITNLLRDLRSSEVSDQNPRSFQLPESSDDSSDDRWPEAGNSDSHHGKNEASGYGGRTHDLKEPKLSCSASASASSDRDYSGFSRAFPDIPDGAFSDGRRAETSSRMSDSRRTPEHLQRRPPWDRYFSDNAGGRGPLRGGGGGARGGGGEEEDSSESDDSIEESELVQDHRLKVEPFDVECEDEGKEFEEETDEKLIDFGNEEKEIADFVFEFNKAEKGKASSAKREGHSLTRDRDLDSHLYGQNNAKMSSEAYRRMLEWRRKLPCFKKKEEIMNAIDSNQVIVISGETGCGKTTQVTQFILDSWIEKGKGSLCRVVCTQPRRISAISIAERVADERAETIGTSVGYQIRLESRLPRDQGSILYCTTGIMLKWLESDPWLAKTSHIILDEVHERDILCDFLMIVLRDLIQRRPDLKLILMSATLNADLFSTYFGNCPMVNVPGYTFPVKEHFLEDIIEMIRYVPNQKNQKKQSFRFGGKDFKEEQQKMDIYRRWVNQLDTRKFSRNTIDVLRSVTFDSSDIDYDLVTALICFIVLNQSMKEGAILVFVPGWEQIRKVIDSLNSTTLFSSKNFQIIPLHSLMPTVNQREVFEHPPPGKRKIVVATNIAETSITIDDVVYVIDCGTTKMKNFDVTNNLSTLQPEWISRANARQRRGRAGRVCPGVCFHLYTSFHHSQLEDFQQPEMLRTRLEELCLQIKLLKLGKIEAFVTKAMQPPSLDSLQLAISTLRDLNALDAREELTPLGYHLAKMPVDPHSGKMLLFAALFSCLDPILTVAASLSFKDAFYIPMGHEAVADERRLQLADGKKSDHLLLVNAFQGWERAKIYGNAYEYCRHNYLSVNTLKMLYNMRKQFSQLLHDMRFVGSCDPKDPSSNRNSGNANLVRAIVCAGLYPNVAKLRPVKSVYSKSPLVLDTKHDQKVYIHPKSVNSKEREFASRWFIFHLKMKTSRIYLYDCSPVSPFSLLFFGGDIKCRKDLGQNCIVIDDWIAFGASKRLAALVRELRQELDKLMERRVTYPCSTNWDRDSNEGALMQAILDILTTEESVMPNYADRRN